MWGRFIQLLSLNAFFLVSICQRPLLPGRMVLPFNRPGKRWPTIPGVQLPDTLPQPNVAPGEIPVHPYNHAFAFAYSIPMNKKGETVGIALTPVNMMDYPAKILLPIFQAEQLRNGDHQSTIFPSPTIPRDRHHLLPSNPFLMTLGYDQFRLRPDHGEVRVTGFIDFPVAWGPGHSRFQLDGDYLQQPATLRMNIPMTDIGKKWYLQQRAQTVNDWPDFHFGHTLRPVNPLNMDIAESYIRGEPFWQPFANSIRPDDNQLFVKRSRQ